MTNGTYKVYNDPNFGAILIADDQTLALRGGNGRYQTSGAEMITLQDLDGEATMRKVGDETLRETFDAHLEGRKPRFVQ